MLIPINIRPILWSKFFLTLGFFCVFRWNLEPSQTKIPTEERTRASGQIAGRKGRVQHRKEELLSIRHDNPEQESAKIQQTSSMEVIWAVVNAFNK